LPQHLEAVRLDVGLVHHVQAGLVADFQEGRVLDGGERERGGRGEVREGRGRARWGRVNGK